MYYLFTYWWIIICIKYWHANSRSRHKSAVSGRNDKVIWRFDFSIQSFIHVNFPSWPHVKLSHFISSCHIVGDLTVLRKILIFGCYWEYHGARRRIFIHGGFIKWSTELWSLIIVIWRINKQWLTWFRFMLVTPLAAVSYVSEVLFLFFLLKYSKVIWNKINFLRHS